MTKLKRMWINQPSKSQPLHKEHGKNVLATEKNEDGVCQIYYVDGDTISAVVPYLSLSDGWV